MANQNNATSNSQSLVIERSEFDYITLDENTGQTTKLKFQLMNPEIRYGDVLIILDGADVCFHGFIGKIEDGWAYASDPNGSSLVARSA